MTIHRSVALWAKATLRERHCPDESITEFVINIVPIILVTVYLTKVNLTILYAMCVFQRSNLVYRICKALWAHESKTASHPVNKDNNNK